MDFSIVHDFFNSADLKKINKWIFDISKTGSEECIIWPFARGRGGYGNLCLLGKYMNAHRVMCILTNGNPPSAMHHASHSCGNGNLGCVNPNHLRWATPKENNNDKVFHGTHRSGDDHQSSKITSSQVFEIRSLKGIKTYHEIGLEYGISKQQVERIINRKRWAHL